MLKISVIHNFATVKPQTLKLCKMIHLAALVYVISLISLKTLPNKKLPDGHVCIRCIPFNFCRDKCTTLEVSVAKCLRVLSRDLSSRNGDHPQFTGSTSERAFYVFPVWHVNHFLLKLQSVLHGGGLQKFLTKELKVLYSLLQ